MTYCIVSKYNKAPYVNGEVVATCDSFSDAIGAGYSVTYFDIVKFDGNVGDILSNDLWSGEITKRGTRPDAFMRHQGFELIDTGGNVQCYWRKLNDGSEIMISRSADGEPPVSLEDECDASLTNAEGEHVEFMGLQQPLIELVEQITINCPLTE